MVREATSEALAPGSTYELGVTHDLVVIADADAPVLTIPLGRAGLSPRDDLLADLTDDGQRIALLDWTGGLHARASASRLDEVRAAGAWAQVQATPAATPAPSPGWSGAVVQEATQATWRSPGFRSAKTRSRWAIALLAISAVVAALGAVEALAFFGQVNTYVAGQATLDEFDHAWTVVTDYPEFVLFLAVPTAIAFLAWLSRSVENAPPLWAGTPTTSPRWAIGWWFVPIMWFFKPYQVVRDLYMQLAVPEAQGGASVVLGWWLSSLAALLVFLLSRYLNLTAALATTGDQWASAVREETGALSAMDLLLVASAWLGALVVREMQHRANLRAERLALAPPEAVWPTVAGLRPSPAGTPQRSPEDTTPPPPPTVAVPDASASAQTATPAQSITPVRPQVPATPPSLVEALATLAEMRDRGLITSAEYDARKAELLSRF